MLKQTLKEWLNEGKERFGEDFAKWRFKCPACGHVNTGKEFKDLGIDLNSMYNECVGRHTGKGSPRKDDSSGCDWAAYGLFGTLGKGRIVLNEGKESEVFDFAE